MLLPLLLAFFTLPAASAAELFVSPAHPAASDSGPGSSASPFRTPARASSPFRTPARATKSLRSGDTLTIAPGVYRESLSFPEAAWGSAATPVQGASGAEVLVKGLDVVTGWEVAGPAGPKR